MKKTSVKLLRRQTSECRAKRATCSIGGGWSRLWLCAHGRKAPHILAESAGFATSFASCALHKRLNFDVWVVAVRAAMSIKLGFCETSRTTQSSACNATTWILDRCCTLLPDLHQHLSLHVLVQNDCKLSFCDVKLHRMLVRLAEQGSVDSQ